MMRTVMAPKFLAFVFSFVLMAGAVMLATGCASTETSTEGSAATEASTESSDSSDTADASGATATEADAEALIGQEMTADDVEAALGTADNITVSAEGCERGVMQGIFYYDGFTVYSRTYDKGNTFTIVSVSE